MASTISLFPTYSEYNTYNFDISLDGKEIKFLGKNNKITSFRVEEYIIQRENVEK